MTDENVIAEVLGAIDRAARTRNRAWYRESWDVDLTKAALRKLWATACRQKDEAPEVFFDRIKQHVRPLAEERIKQHQKKRAVLHATSLPKNCKVIDAEGKQLTEDIFREATRLAGRSGLTVFAHYAQEYAYRRLGGMMTHSIDPMHSFAVHLKDSEDRTWLVTEYYPPDIIRLNSKTRSVFIQNLGHPLDL